MVRAECLTRHFASLLASLGNKHGSRRKPTFFKFLADGFVQVGDFSCGGRKLHFSALTAITEGFPSTAARVCSGAGYDPDPSRVPSISRFVGDKAENCHRYGCRNQISMRTSFNVTSVLPSAVTDCAGDKVAT